MQIYSQFFRKLPKILIEKPLRSQNKKSVNVLVPINSLSHHRNLPEYSRNKLVHGVNKNMKVKIFILIFSFYTSQVLGNIKAFLTDFSSFNGLSFLRLGSCDPTKCPPIPVHYDELGCKPVVNDGECCPFR